MNSKQTMVFNENMCRTVFPGMVDSIRTLIEDSTAERGRNFHAGYINSAVILSAHIAELLLKYKIEREGKSFKKNHDLHELYTKLQVESKTQIQREFDILASEANISASDLPPNWNSVGAVFNSARKFSIGWRYLAEMNDDVLDVHPWVLYTAVLSVFRTTPFRYSINVDEPPIRVEDIPDSDLRERALNYIRRDEKL